MNGFQKSCLIFLTLFILILLAAACTKAPPTPVTMAGYWMDNDFNETTIKQQGDQFVAETTYATFASASQNSLVSSSFENGVLTWKYCPPAKPCITMTTVAFHGDTLDVKWTDDNGNSGTMTLERTDQPPNNKKG